MRTEGLSILAAVVLHGGVLLVARGMPPLALLTATEKLPERYIDLELPTSLPPELRVAPPLPAEVAPAPAARTEERPPETRVGARGAVIPGGPAAPSTSEPVAPDQNPQPPSTARGSQFDELPPDDGKGGVLGVPGVPGLGGPVWRMPGVLPTGVAAAAPAPTVAPAPRPVDPDIAGKVIRDAMASNDKEKGIDLPVAGSIRSAIYTAVMGSDIPAGAKGSITCNVSPSGVVSNCRVRSSTGGGADAWAVVTRAGAAVAGTSLPGQYARGAVVTVNISVALAPPAGGKGGISGAGATFDISNIGAHATRQVKTSHTVVANP